MLKTTDKTPRTTLPARDKERDYELEHSLEMSTILAQRAQFDLTDSDE